MLAFKFIREMRDSVMRIYGCTFMIAVFLLGILFSCHSNKNSGNTSGVSKHADRISIRVLKQSAYCGGVRPSQEQEEEMKIKHPVAGEMIYIREGAENNPDAVVVDSALTDAMGEARFLLSPGTYCVIRKNRVDRAYYNSLIRDYRESSRLYSKVDTTCLNAWIKTPELILQVGNKSPRNVEFLVYNPCWWNAIPCVEYNGSLPN